MNKLYDLLQFFKICLKNIWRNRRRSTLTIISIAVGSVALSLLSGYVKTMEIGLKDQAISKEYGHFQIIQKGYLEADSNSFEYLIPESVFTKIEEKLYSLEAVDIVNKQLNIVGMIGNQERSTIFSAICGDASAQIFMLPEVIEGFPLSSTEPNGIVIGKNLAERLKAKPGDELLLFFTSETRSQEAIYGKVKGLYKGIMAEQEKIIIYIPLEAAWNLMLEKKVHRIIVFLNDIKNLDKATHEMQKFIDENNFNLEIKTWSDLAVYFKQIIDMFRGLIMFGGFIILFVIIFGISNTMYMIINERTKEIGTIRAIGKSKTNVILLFITEGMFMGLFGGILSTILSLIMIPFINSMNFMLPPGPGQSDPIPISITFEQGTIALVAVLGILTAIAASVFPSLSIVRKKIVDAMRQFN